MINLSFINGTGLVFNVDEWHELRSKHRIVGELIGFSKTSTMQLPLALCPEEVHLLTKKGIAKLVRYEKLEKPPTAEDKAKFDEETTQLYEEQKVIFKEERRKQLESMIDKIMQGKKKIGEGSKSKEEVIEEELNKLIELKEDSMLLPIYTQHPDYLRGEPTDVSTSEIYEHTNPVRCAVFEDLWDRGYYITNGTKFGGDFLVYLGDPVIFHAVYIVRCIVDNEQLHNVTEIVACGRLGNSVKKKFVWASINAEGVVSYVTINWMDA